MVNLLFLSPSSTSSTFPLSALPTDSIHVLKVQLAALHPSCPRVEDVQLVRGGRFLNDQETVQDVLGLGKAEREEEEEDGRPHTIHLVLRGGGQGGEKREVMSSSMERTTTTTTSLPPPSIAAAAAPTTPILPPPPPSTPSSSSSTPPILLPPDRVLDLSDAVGLYAHLSRSSLCTLLNLPSLAWEEILPTPQVSEAEAKRLVKQTVEGFGVQSGFGEEEEEGEGGRLEDWVGEDGGEWSVEVDGLPYHLSVPPPSLLTPIQRSALHSYLLSSTRLTLLHQIIANPIPYLLAMLPPPSPTPTQQRPRRQSAWIRVVPMMLMNAVKYALVWYIFTQGETVLSRSLWGLALVGWWVYEGWGEVRRIAGGEPGAGAVPPAARAVAAQAVQPIPAGAAVLGTTDSTSSSDPSAPSPPPRPLPTFHLPPTSSPFHSLALIGLANESTLLSLSPSSSETPHAPPTSPTTLLQTLLLAPLLLLLSIAPPLEALRSSAIRSRERVMRELVEVLTRNAANEAQNLEGEGDASALTSTPTVVVPPPPPPPIHGLLPPGLGIEAKGYYRRVLERGERIDWAEEEEAQREGLRLEREREREREGGGGLGGLF